MMTMTQTESNTFNVFVDGEWAGDVWSVRESWTAMDFDGDTWTGFGSFLFAARFLVQMRGAAR